MRLHTHTHTKKEKDAGSRLWVWLHVGSAQMSARCEGLRLPMEKVRGSPRADISALTARAIRGGFAFGGRRRVPRPPVRLLCILHASRASLQLLHSKAWTESGVKVGRPWVRRFGPGSVRGFLSWGSGPGQQERQTQVKSSGITQTLRRGCLICLDLTQP